jgi:uncharacterized protein
MNPFISNVIAQNQNKIRGLCRKLDVKELLLFGSAVSDNFDPARSDLDFVAEFNRADASGIADRFMALATGLESIFNRNADLITKPAIKNPIFRRIVEETSIRLYEA